MSPLRFILEKEFKQIFRNPAILKTIFILPVIQLVMLPMAADYEIKNINIAIVNRDRGTISNQLVQEITASQYFKMVLYPNNRNAAMRAVETEQADLILEIPLDFEKSLYKYKASQLSLSVNAINGVKGNLGAAYLNTIVQQFNQKFRLKTLVPGRVNDFPQIQIQSSNWYNPKMNYKRFMVPGILVLLITIVGMNLSSINIVREKEMGTIEQINVTPVKKSHFILGKLLPFWLIGLVVISVGFVVAWLVYGIIPAGSYFTLYLFAAVYLLVILGIGLLISSYSENQQQAMLVTFFLMMIFVLMGGLYTSIDSMPEWAIGFTKLNPISYFIDVMRMVVLKGSSLQDILPQIGIMIFYAFVINTWAVFSYRKRS